MFSLAWKQMEGEHYTGGVLGVYGNGASISYSYKAAIAVSYTAKAFICFWGTFFHLIPSVEISIVLPVPTAMKRPLP